MKFGNFWPLQGDGKGSFQKFLVFGCNIKTFFRIEKQTRYYFLKKNDFCRFFFSGSRSTNTGFMVRGSIPV